MGEIRTQLLEAEAALAKAKTEQRKVREEMQGLVEDAEDRLQVVKTEAAELEVRLKQQQEAWEEEKAGWAAQAAREKEEKEEGQGRMQARWKEKEKEAIALQGEVEKARKEAKTKGDMARKLLEEKDKEIDALRRALEQRVVVGGEESKREEDEDRGGGSHAPSPPASSSSSPPPLSPAVAVPSPPPPPIALRPESHTSVATDQQIILAARIQAQRDEEVTRLKQQLRALGDALREKEQGLVHLEEEVRAKDKQVGELQRAAGRERELSSGGQEAQDRLTYLKNAIYRYLASPPEAVSERNALVPVICTILRFSQEETTEVQKAVVANTPGPIGEGVGYLSSLLWRGGAGASGGHHAPHVMTPGRRRSSGAGVEGGGGGGGGQGMVPRPASSQM